MIEQFVTRSKGLVSGKGLSLSPSKQRHTSLSSVSIASIRPAIILYLASMVEDLEECVLLLLLWLAQGDSIVSNLDDERYNEQSELES